MDCDDVMIQGVPTGQTLSGSGPSNSYEFLHSTPRLALTDHILESIQFIHRYLGMRRQFMAPTFGSSRYSKALHGYPRVFRADQLELSSGEQNSIPMQLL